LDVTPIVADVVESNEKQARLVVGTERGYCVMDLTSPAVDPVPFTEEMGRPVKVLDVGQRSGLIVLCYESMRLYATDDNPQISES
jgi:hypothetical protein